MFAIVIILRQVSFCFVHELLLVWTSCDIILEELFGFIFFDCLDFFFLLFFIFFLWWALLQHKLLSTGYRLVYTFVLFFFSSACVEYMYVAPLKK